MSTSTSKTYHHGALREALIASALELLEEGGLSTLSLREVARRSGVSAMAPYRHFADRDALLAGIATIGFERFRDALTAADAAHRGRDALTAQGAAYVEFARAHPALFRLMFNAGTAPTAELEAASSAAYAVLTERVASLVEPHLVDDWSLACWSLVHGMAMLALDGLIEPAGPVGLLAARLLQMIDISGTGMD